MRLMTPPLERQIETERLVLRQTLTSDIERLVGELNDFTVSGMLARVPFPYTRGDAHRFIASVDANVGRDLALAIVRDGTIIGGIGLSGIAVEREFGYWLGRAHWGYGYATEAGQAFLAHVFRTYDIDMIRSGVFVDNPASLRVQEKLGFVRIGGRIVHSTARGRGVEHIDTILTRDKFLRIAP